MERMGSIGISTPKITPGEFTNGEKPRRKPPWEQVKKGDYGFLSKGKSPQETLLRAKRTILRLIKDLNPQALAVEKAFFSKNRNASLLNVLVDEIRSIAKRKGIRLLAYAPSTVKKFTCGNGRATKEEVSRVVVSKYPELRVYLTQDCAWKERFHQNMFDAVALGIMAARAGHR